MRNIVLTGMPGAGKSTVGVILAKTLKMNFLDTDLVIQERTGLSLQDIIDRDGPAEFMRVEEAAVLSLACHRTVVATGGSVVLSPPAMAHLKANGTVVYLNVPFEEIEKRLGNIRHRGIILPSDQTLRTMYDGRAPLYEKYADITMDCAGRDFETVISTLMGTPTLR